MAVVMHAQVEKRLKRKTSIASEDFVRNIIISEQCCLGKEKCIPIILNARLTWKTKEMA